MGYGVEAVGDARHSEEAKEQLREVVLERLTELAAADLDGCVSLLRLAFPGRHSWLVKRLEQLGGAAAAAAAAAPAAAQQAAQHAGRQELLSRLLLGYLRSLLPPRGTQSVTPEQARGLGLLGITRAIASTLRPARPEPVAEAERTPSIEVHVRRFVPITPEFLHSEFLTRVLTRVAPRVMAS